MFMKEKDLYSKPLPGQVPEENDSHQLTPLINLTQLKNGKAAKVIRIQGGHHMIDKLEAMEIVPGSIIVKKSASLMKGPVVIEKGNMQFAIGYGMARRIIVEPVEQNQGNRG